MNGIPWFESETGKYNPLLKPERTTSYEVGTDLRFWNNRINFDFTYYTKTTVDQIIRAATSTVTGYNTAMFNTGKVKNYGIELSLNIIPVEIKDFKWDITLNWAQNKSKVLKIGEGLTSMEIGSAEGTVRFVLEEGRSMGTLYAKMAKLNDNGQMLVNSDGRPLFEDNQFLADVTPDWLGGIQNSFSYKGFSANVLFDFREGGKIWSSTSHQGSRDGQTISSLEGRNDYMFSNLVLGENGEERKGYLQPTHTVNPNATSNPNGTIGELVPYAERDRPKGMIAPNAVYDESVALIAGQNNISWINPGAYWMNTDANARYYLYDASFIKLRELSVGYDLPKNLLKQMSDGFLQSVKISLVGRNLAILHQNTPKGIDPEASSTLGVMRGLEKGFSLPTSTYGFDIKVTF